MKKQGLFLIAIVILLLLASCEQSVQGETDSTSNSGDQSEPFEVPHNWKEYTKHKYLRMSHEELLEQYPDAITWYEFTVFRNERNKIVLVEYDVDYNEGRSRIYEGKRVYVYPARDTLPTKAECEKLSEGMSIYEMIACLGMPSDAFEPSGRYPGFAYTTVEGDSFLVLINGFPNTVFQTSFPVIPKSSPYEDESKPNT